MPTTIISTENIRIARRRTLRGLALNYMPHFVAICAVPLIGTILLTMNKIGPVAHSYGPVADHKSAVTALKNLSFKDSLLKDIALAQLQSLARTSVSSVPTMNWPKMSDQDRICIAGARIGSASLKPLDLYVCEAGSSGFAYTGTGFWVDIFNETSFDHIEQGRAIYAVSLTNVWKSGAYAWPDSWKQAFVGEMFKSTDPWSILVVSNLTAIQRGEAGPDRWMPEFQKCLYAKIDVAIRSRWKLSVSDSERKALASALNLCEK